MNELTKNMELDAWNVSTSDVDEFITVVKELTNKTQWNSGITSKALLVEPIAGPIEAGQVAQKCNCSESIAYDTGENTKLLIRIGLNRYCVRNTAILSILDTAKIKGSALGRLTQYDLSQVLNYCLGVAKGNSLVLHQAGKVSAVLSDNNGGYRVMPQPELVEISIQKMIQRFHKVDFKSGTVSHNLTYFIAELPEAKEKLNEAYNKSVIFTGRKVDLMPAVLFCTSDTGDSAATLKPLYRLTGEKYYFPINDGLKVTHVRSKGSSPDGVEKFEEVSGMIHAKFEDTAETIGKMAKLVINNPMNAYVAIMKKVGIAQKYAKDGYDDLLCYCGGQPCSMNDVYLSATRCLSTAKMANASGSVVRALDDAVSRILCLRWEDFDIPGTVAWGTAAAA